MHADLSRITYRADRRYSAVVAQQGRVQLDADLNEQAAIQVAAVRALAADLIGPDGGPRGDGFKITHVPGNGGPDSLTIGAGRYYVGGIACDATPPDPGVTVPDEGLPVQSGPPDRWTYWTQPDGYRDPQLAGDRLPDSFPYLVYLKVWERSVTAAEDPALREVALGSAAADTAARVKLVWQVLAKAPGDIGVTVDADAGQLRRALRRTDVPGLAARASRPDDADSDLSLVSPDASYRGPENQLYRVEIHDGGTAAEATVKWSRENGSVVLPVDAIDGTWVELSAFGGDNKLDLSVGDWVEVVDTAYASRLETLPLLAVEEVDLPGHRVRLSAEPDSRVGRRRELHPYLRRWDQASTAITLNPGQWMALEDGVEIYFADGDAQYLTGDYWQVPARTVTGDVEWPSDATGRPLILPPAGIMVHAAPLAWVTQDGVTDCRLQFPPLASETAAPAADQKPTSDPELTTDPGPAPGPAPEDGTASAQAPQAPQPIQAQPPQSQLQPSEAQPVAALAAPKATGTPEDSAAKPQAAELQAAEPQAAKPSAAKPQGGNIVTRGWNALVNAIRSWFRVRGAEHLAAEAGKAAKSAETAIAAEAGKLAKTAEAVVTTEAPKIAKAAESVIATEAANITKAEPPKS